MAGLNAVPGQICSYPGNFTPAESNCQGPLPVTIRRAGSRVRTVTRSPKLFLEHAQPLLLKVAQEGTHGYDRPPENTEQRQRPQAPPGS